VATEVEAQIAGSLWKIEKAVGDAGRAAHTVRVIASTQVQVPPQSPCPGTVADLGVAAAAHIADGPAPAAIG